MGNGRPCPADTLDNVPDYLPLLLPQGIPCELLVNVDSITEHDRWSQLAAGNGEPPGEISTAAQYYNRVPQVTQSNRRRLAFKVKYDAEWLRGSFIQSRAFQFRSCDTVPVTPRGWVFHAIPWCRLPHVFGRSLVSCKQPVLRQPARVACALCGQGQALGGACAEAPVVSNTHFM